MRTLPEAQRHLERTARRLIPALGAARGSVAYLEVLAVGETRMRNAHRRYDGRAVVSDVLSFPSSRTLQRAGLWGSVVVCLPVCRRQARRFGWSVRHELTLALVHGFLHIQGFDHERGPAAARQMAREEKRWLKRLGVPSSGLITRAGKMAKA